MSEQHALPEAPPEGPAGLTAPRGPVLGDVERAAAATVPAEFEYLDPFQVRVFEQCPRPALADLVDLQVEPLQPGQPGRARNGDGAAVAHPDAFQPEPFQRGQVFRIKERG